MAYEIKSKDGKYYVVDSETNKVRGTYDSEDDAEDRKDELDFRNHVRSRLERIPVAEMTAEEKAAAYDKMMADKAASADKNLPPKIDPTANPPKDTKVKKLSYWPQDEN